MNLVDGKVAIGSLGYVNFIGIYRADKQILEDVQTIIIDAKNNSLMILPPVHPALLVNKISDKAMKMSIPMDKFLFTINVGILKQADDLERNYYGMTSDLDLGNSKKVIY